MSIFPYIYFMIEDFHITDDANKIAIYAGMVTSAFTFAEFSTGLMWGKISDKVGRKPVLMMGLIGTAISVLMFGFATSLPLALFARALGGILNGYDKAKPKLRPDRAPEDVSECLTEETGISLCCRRRWRNWRVSRNISVRCAKRERSILNRVSQTD
jgi:MFS family permease